MMKKIDYSFKFSDLIGLVLSAIAVWIALEAKCIAQRTLDLGASLEKQQQQIEQQAQMILHLEDLNASSLTMIGHLSNLDSSSIRQLGTQMVISSKVSQELKSINGLYAQSIKRERVSRENDSAFFRQSIDTLYRSLDRCAYAGTHNGKVDFSDLYYCISSAQKDFNSRVTVYNEYLRTSLSAKRVCADINGSLDQMNIMLWPKMGDSLGKMKFLSGFIKLLGTMYSPVRLNDSSYAMWLDRKRNLWNGR